MRMYDVTIKVRVVAENEEIAKMKALEVLSSEGLKYVEITAEELGKLSASTMFLRRDGGRIDG